jgi:hypothetical protein
MLVFYALEARAAVFVLAFAVACAASSLYGFLQGAWPFGVVEAIWCIVALRRWWRRYTLERQLARGTAAPDTGWTGPGKRVSPHVPYLRVRIVVLETGQQSVPEEAER